MGAMRKMAVYLGLVEDELDDYADELRSVRAGGAAPRACPGVRRRARRVPPA